MRFLDDGRIELDTNIVERSIRPIVLNRKNALFAGHDQGRGELGVHRFTGRDLQTLWRRSAGLFEPTCSPSSSISGLPRASTNSCPGSGAPSRPKAAPLDEFRSWVALVPEVVVTTSPVSPGSFSKPLRAALRQAERCCGEISCRRATSETIAPGA